MKFSLTMYFICGTIKCVRYKRGVEVKKHKIIFATLTLLLGVLCYAFYEGDVKEYEEEIDLSSELLTMNEIKDKNLFTIELLSLPIPEENRQLKTLKELEEEINKENKEEVTEEPTTLTEAETNEEEVVETYSYEPVYTYIPEYNEELAT